MKNNSLYFASTAILASLLCITTARAQSVDYGSAEQMFGEPVTTSATGSPQRVTEAPADMEIITADDIRRTGAHSIADVMEFVAGMDVRRSSSENTETNIRGEIQPLTPRLLVLVNGRQVYLDYYGYVPWSSIPVQMSEIRQIEIVKGPNSALFGFNAVSGVINIITYSPLKDDVSTAQASWGSQSYRNGSAVITHHFLGDTVGVKLSAGVTREREFTTDIANKSHVNDDNKLRSIALDTRWQVLPNVELSMEGSRADTKDLEMSAVGLPGNMQYGISSIKGGALADTFLGLIDVEGYNTHSDIWKRFPALNRQLSYKTDLVVGKVSDLFKIGSDHTIRLSVEYRDTNNLSISSLSGNTGVGYKVWSGSAMWNWTITPRLSLMNSVRYDDLGIYWMGPFPKYVAPITSPPAPSMAQYNSTAIKEFSYNSGLVYKLSDADTVRVLAGRGVQVPSLFDFANIGTGVAPYAIDLKPSIQENYEIGYDRKLDEIKSTVRVAVYHLVSTELLEYAKANAGSSTQNGIEISLKGKSESGFRWNASFVHRLVSDHVGFSALAGTQLIDFKNGTPKTKVVLGAGYSFDGFEVDLQGRWQSKFVDLCDYSTSTVPTPTTIRAYFAPNARIAYNVANYFTVAISGSQLLESKQIQTAGYRVDRRFFVTLTKGF